jgi:high affinity Mn2+ porin
MPIRSSEEVDETVQLGVGGNGKAWKRKLDRVGIAFVSNGISRDHQEYLALGGDGFILGDGKLNYGRENIVEPYLHPSRLAGDIRLVRFPIYPQPWIQS